MKQLDRTQAPEIHDAISFTYQLPPIQKHICDNNIPIYWLDAGVQEVVEINWVFPAGVWYETKPMLSQAVAALLKSGTIQHTANEINEALEFYGASLHVNPGNDFAVVSLYTLTKHLPVLLPTVYEVLTEAVFPQEELEIFQRNSIQKLSVNLRKCEFVANQKFDALLFGEDHPYGRYTRNESIEALTREDLQAFHKEYYHLGLVQIFMAGRLTQTDVNLVASVFGKGHIVQKPLAQKISASPPPSQQKLHINHDPNGVQGAIRIGRIFPNRVHPDYPGMVVLNTILGGYFGSRLMRNIREEKGYTYGIYSMLSSWLHAGVFVIATETGRQVTMNAVEEVYKEMDILCKEQVSEEELLLVKNYLLGNLLGDLDGPFQILQRWRSLILYGLDENYFYNSVEMYKTINSEKLLQLAHTYFKPELLYEVVVI